MQVTINGTTMPVTSREESRAARREIAKTGETFVWVTDDDGARVGKLHAATAGELAAWDATPVRRLSRRARAARMITP